MRTVKLLLLTCIFTVSIVVGQEDQKLNSIKSSIDQLFDLAKKNDYSKLSFLIAYSGKDIKRNLKTHFNFTDSNEAGKVKRISKKIKAFLDISDKYELGKFENKIDNDIIFYSIEVIFVSGSQRLGTVFSFVELGDKMLLADLN